MSLDPAHPLSQIFFTGSISLAVVSCCSIQREKRCHQQQLNKNYVQPLDFSFLLPWFSLSLGFNKKEMKKGKKNWEPVFSSFLFLVCALYLLTLHELLLQNSSLDQPFQVISKRNKKYSKRFDIFTVRYYGGSEHVKGVCLCTLIQHFQRFSHIC